MFSTLKRTLLSLSVALGITLGLTLSAQASDTAPFKILIEKLAKAQLEFDPATMDGLLGQNFVEVSPKGEVDHRAEVLSFYDPSKKPPAGKVPAIEISEVEAKLYGDHAFVIAKETFIIPGSPNKFAMRVSFMMEKTTDGWMFVGAQYTGIRP